MNGNVNLYDTYKANKDGKRYRVTEVGNETVKLVKLNEDGTRKHAGGRPRIMTVADLFRDFTKVNLPPVRVSKIEPQKPIQEEVEEVGKPSENAAEKQKQTVREINHPEAHTLEDTFEEFRKKNVEPDVAPTYSQQFHEAVREAAGEMANENDQLWEINKNLRIRIMEQNKEIRKLNKAIEDRATDNNIEILKAELIDMKKTISKIRQQHEAEVADLKDRIMEEEAEANAVKKRKDEILAERTQYADALDNDSVAFEDILSLAETIQLVSTSAAKLAKQIIGKTEGRI